MVPTPTPILLQSGPWSLHASCQPTLPVPPSHSGISRIGQWLYLFFGAPSSENVPRNSSVCCRPKVLQHFQGSGWRGLGPGDQRGPLVQLELCNFPAFGSGNVRNHAFHSPKLHCTHRTELEFSTEKRQEKQRVNCLTV